MIGPPGIGTQRRSARLESAGLDGVTVNWEEEGEGLPVVLVHGLPTSSRLWRHVIPLVSGGRCLAWEMLGYGSSIPEGIGRDISVSRQADYLLAWMDSVNIRRAIFVGHDLGGGVVQIAAVRRPGACAGLVLTNSICYDSWPVPIVRAVRAAGPLLERLPNPVFKPTFFPVFYFTHDNGRRAAESARVHWNGYATHHAAAAFVRQIRSLDVRDTIAVAHELPHLNVPARVVWGAADGFLKVGYGERLARDLGTTLERIEGGKHFTPEDHPERIAAAVNDLLREAG